MKLNEINIVHVNNVANVGSNLVSGLNEIGVNAKLYILRRVDNKRIPQFLRTLLNACLGLIEIFRFRRYVKNEKINLIHIHYGTHAYLAFLNGFPFFLHLHGTDIRTHINFPFLGAIIQIGIKKAKLVFYSTPDLKPMIEPFRSDAILLINPVNINKFFPQSDLPKQRIPVIFCINKIDRFKGVTDILKALQFICDNKPSVVIKMFNFGNNLVEAKDFINRNNSKKNVIFLQKVSHEQMVENIQSSTIIIGQIETGALGVSEFEAMACGKPVICNYYYSLGFQIEPPVFQATTYTEIIKQINYLLENPLEGEIKGLKARKWVENYLSNEIVVKRLINFYQNNCYTLVKKGTND